MRWGVLSGAWSPTWARLIWPMLTLILKKQNGHERFGNSQPAAFAGLRAASVHDPGRQAGRQVPQAQYYHCVRPLVTVASYMVCAFLPVSGPMVAPDVPCGRVLHRWNGPATTRWWPIFPPSGPSASAYQPELSGRQPGHRAWRLFWAAFYLKNHLNLAFAISSAATFSSTR